MNEIEIRRRPGITSPASNGDVLPEHRQKQVEAGLAQYQAVLAERDELQGKLKDALVKIDGMQVQLNAIQGVVNMMESTLKTYQIQRDEAVTKAARLDTTLRNAFMLLANETYDDEQSGGKPA